MFPKVLRFESTRETLLAQLQRSEASLIMLLAPAGFGKTTLMAQYARQIGRRVAWLSLNINHRDPARFQEALHHCLGTAFPECEFQDPLNFQQAAQQLNELDENILIVLDDFRDLHVETLHWFAGFVLELQEGHQVMLSAYQKPLLPLSLRYSAEQVLTLDGQQLMFSDQEIDAYLGLRGLVRPSDTEARGVVGWPAGLAMLGTRFPGSQLPGDLVYNLLATLPDTIALKMPELAILPLWSEALAGRMGLDLPAGWLAVLERSGLPMTPLDANTFAPHSLVTRVLAQELGRSPARAQALYLQAGERAEQGQQPLLALQHYELGANSDAALTLATKLTSEYLWRQDYHSALAVLDALRQWTPLSHGLEQVLALAMVRTQQVAQGEALAAQLLERQPVSPDAVRALGHAAMRRGDRNMQLHYARLLGRQAVNRSQQLDAIRLEVTALIQCGFAQQAAAQVGQLMDETQAVHPLEWATSYLTAHLAYENLGDWVQSERSLRAALEIYESLQSHQQMAVALNALALIQGRQGRTVQGLDTLQRALNETAAERSDIYPILLETRADLLLWNAEFRAAELAYQEALTHARQRQIRPLETRIQLGRVQALTQLGDLSAAGQLLAEASEVAPGTDGLLQAGLAFQRGLLGFAAGDSGAALQHWAQIPPPFVSDLQRLYELAARQPLGPWDRAGLGLGRDLAGGLAPHLLRVHQTTLQAVLARIQPTVPMQVAVATQVTAQAGVPARPMLTVWTLGRLRVVLDGQAVHLPFAKTGELLAYLALQGHVGRDEVLDALWDGSSEERHVNYFKLTTRKLRAALQDRLDFNPLPYHEQRYSLAGGLDVRCDALTVLEARNSRDPALLDAAVQAYGGLFLPDAEGEWAEGVRTQLHEVATLCGLRLIEHLPLDQALAVGQRLLQLDPLSEELYQALLQAHVQAQDHAGAQKTYQTYARMLRREFNTEPDPELRRRFSSR